MACESFVEYLVGPLSLQHFQGFWILKFVGVEQPEPVHGFYKLFGIC